MKKSIVYWVCILWLGFGLISCNQIKDSDHDGDFNENSNNKEDLLEKEENEMGEYDIAFSHTDNFYSKDIKVEIISNAPCKIYYTTDGSDPDEEDELYKEAIEFKALNEPEVTSLKAKAFFDDGMTSEVIINTYFVGRYIGQRFQHLVFSITTDPYNLYDREHGILKNYEMRGRESERVSFLQIMEPDGTKVVEQTVGIRVFGGYSRSLLQKSIRILARKEYDEENNKLRYEFFPQKTAANGDGTKLCAFKRIVLRNSGNDNSNAFIRDELFQTLAGHAGYKDYQAVRPAVLFMNGDYHGMFWLHEVQKNEEYFKENYGKYDGYFETLEGGETFKDIDDGGENKAAVDNYNEMYDKYTNLDLTIDKNYNELKELVDVENYLRYYALQIYIGNEDWPHNNYKTYRYYKSENEEYGEAPFDGKWRYFLHDLDFGFGIYGADPFLKSIYTYIGKNGEVKKEAPLFGQLMQREDCREIFITMTMDLVNGAFAPDFINEVLDRMNNSRIHELKNMYGTNLLEHWVQFDQLEWKLNEIRDFGLKRAWDIPRQYQDFFELGDVYDLRVEPSVGSEISINTFKTFDNFEGSYYVDYDTVINTTVPAGQQFDYWLVNDTKVYDKELVISESRIQDGKVEVKCVFKENPEDPKLIISQLSADGNRDYIIIHNPYSVKVSAAGYALTDDVSKDERFWLPSIILMPDESVKILCEDHPDTLEKGQYRADFNLKTGENLVLLRKEEIVDEVLIPNLKNFNPYKRELSTMRFYEVDN